MSSPVLQLLLACGLLLAAVNTANCSVEAPRRRKMKAATVEDDRERERNQRVRYTASWAVEITSGGDKMADVVARRHGYRNLGKVANLLVIEARSCNISQGARVGWSYNNCHCPPTCT